MWFFKRRKAKKEAEKKAEQEKLEHERIEKEKEEQEKIEKQRLVDEKAKKKNTSKETEKKKETGKVTSKIQKKASDKEEVLQEDENSEIKVRKAVYRVVFDKESGLWKIKKDGAKRVIASMKTKEDALSRVQELSQNQDSKFVVYKKDGKFQKKANLKLKNNKEEK